MSPLNIGLEAWIIQDGNYGDFDVGGCYRFALEFSPHDLRAVDNPARRPPELRLVEGADYQSAGEIVRVARRNWVVDFGVLAFQESRPPRWARPGLAITGTVRIGIDPFFYFERLKDEPGMPDLFQEWRVRRILLETTPWIETRDATGRAAVVQRADVPRSFADVRSTNAWKDDGGHAHYILESEMQRTG